MGESVPCYIDPVNRHVVSPYAAGKGDTPALAIPMPVVERVREQLETIASLTDCMTIKTRCAAALSPLEHTP